MSDSKKLEKFKQARSNLALDPEQGDFSPNPRSQPDNSEWNPDDWYGMTEDEAMEEDLMEVLMRRGKEIAKQEWSGGSWSSVYEYKGRFYSIDEDPTIHERTAKMLQYYRPTRFVPGDYPQYSFLCGATQGGRKSYFLENPFSMKNFGAVDSEWLEGVRDRNDACVINTDDFSFLVQRRTNGSHTWSADMERLLENSQVPGYKLRDIHL